MNVRPHVIRFAKEHELVARVLFDHGPLTTERLARRCGLNLPRVRKHLRRLKAAGRAAWTPVWYDSHSYARKWRITVEANCLPTYE